jgi:hypothetical protein
LNINDLSYAPVTNFFIWLQPNVEQTSIGEGYFDLSGTKKALAQKSDFGSQQMASRGSYDAPGS